MTPEALVMDTMNLAYTAADSASIVSQANSTSPALDEKSIQMKPPDILFSSPVIARLDAYRGRTHRKTASAANFNINKSKMESINKNAFWKEFLCLLLPPQPRQEVFTIYLCNMWDIQGSKPLHIIHLDEVEVKVHNALDFSLAIVKEYPKMVKWILHARDLSKNVELLNLIRKNTTEESDVQPELKIMFPQSNSVSVLPIDTKTSIFDYSKEALMLTNQSEYKLYARHGDVMLELCPGVNLVFNYVPSPLFEHYILEMWKTLPPKEPKKSVSGFVTVKNSQRMCTLIEDYLWLSKPENNHNDDVLECPMEKCKYIISKDLQSSLRESCCSLLWKPTFDFGVVPLAEVKKVTVYCGCKFESDLVDSLRSNEYRITLTFGTNTFSFGVYTHESLHKWVNLICESIEKSVLEAKNRNNEYMKLVSFNESIAKRSVDEQDRLNQMKSDPSLFSKKINLIHASLKSKSRSGFKKCLVLIHNSTIIVCKNRDFYAVYRTIKVTEKCHVVLGHVNPITGTSAPEKTPIDENECDEDDPEIITANGYHLTVWIPPKRFDVLKRKGKRGKTFCFKFSKKIDRDSVFLQIFK